MSISLPVPTGGLFAFVWPYIRLQKKDGGLAGAGKSYDSMHEKGAQWRNAVHLSGAALRFTGKRVFDIFTALGLDGLGRFSMNMTP
ncbi:MAG: hypothetical protein ACK4E9_18925, partial [Aeromonas media]